MKRITRKDFLRGSAAGACTIAMGMFPGVAYAEETTDGEVVASGEKYTATMTADGWIKVVNDGGATLGYSADSGMTLIEDDGYAFKDLNGSGELDAYKDWRLDADTRAENLVSLMDVQDELPLMLLGLYDFSYVPGEIDTITERLDAGLRASCTPFALIATDTWGQYVNKAQAYVEAKDAYGIPIEFCSEISAVTSISSYWSNALSLASTMSPDTAFEAGKQISLEMRALGIAGSMAPQADVATDPRWARFSGTFGEDPQLTSDMISAFVNGFQSTFDEDGNDLGWGTDSVLTQIKHFPGEGSEEGGRNSHSDYGKYLIYPTEGSMDALITPFRDTMSLSGETGQISGVMPCYSVLIGSDGNPLDDEEVGGGFSDYLLQDVLRGELGFDGVISSDFEIMSDRPYGVEDLTIPERYLKSLIAGVDRFGGESDPTDFLEAYQLGVEEYGEEYMKERIDESAFRLLRNYFRVGLFENAYVSQEYMDEVVNNDDAKAAGYESLAASVVMLKNAGNLIQESSSDEKPVVYIPYVYDTSSEEWVAPADLDYAANYFEVVTDSFSGDTLTRASADELASVDYAFVKVSSPEHNGGYDTDSETYLPVSLQYSEYTTTNEAAKEAFANGVSSTALETPYGTQYVTEEEDRSYYGQTVTVANYQDLDTILYAAENCEHVMVCIDSSNPMVVSEFEDQVDVILLNFNVVSSTTSAVRQLVDDSIYNIVTGKAEPSGLLPFQMPADMDTVEEQAPDVSRDMVCHVDSEGNTYDFTFGLNWSGVISDERTETYSATALGNEA